ncbi:hypothetical protein SDC9_143458 [bioreactor metagenome]|uniref:Uncharacterized protein n=1 Tax=bioreactor metagenome TaxID=1076179 RepID=A0A645E3F9_9ZZZZ
MEEVDSLLSLRRNLKAAAQLAQAAANRFKDL